MIQNNPKHIALISLALLGISQGFPGRSSASSLIREYLATISEVQVIFPIGGLQYDPPPGIDLDTLEMAVLSVANSALEREGVRATDAAPQHLVIWLQYDRDRDIAVAQHAFHILLELEEEAILSRRWDCNEERTVWVTSWKRSFLALTPENLALERILEVVDLGVTALAQTIVQARAAAVGVEPGTVMEQGPSAETLGAELREFSNKDAELLRNHLNQ
jgi:hypothetical protein